MGKFIFFGLLLILLLVGGFFSWNKLQDKKALTILHQSLPSLLIPDLDGEQINLSRLLGANTSIVTYFNTTCHLCQSEAELLVSNFQNRDELQFVFISSQPVDEIRQFRKEYKLDKLSNSIFLSDTLFLFATQFKLQGTPVTFVYNSKGMLVKEFLGTFKIQELKDAIDQPNGS